MRGDCQPFRYRFTELTQSVHPTAWQLMHRTVQPELLDQLPHDDAEAIASRRDLRMINALMGNFRWVKSMLQRDHTDDTQGRYLELGAGDGSLARTLIPTLPQGSYDALDIAPEPSDWPSSGNWLRHDCLSFDDYGDYSHVIANLFLHHLEDEHLGRLGARLDASPIRMIVACEPCRRSAHKWPLRAGRCIGFNRVTLNDGCISVDAGFRGDELPRLLKLPTSDWRWTIRETFMGAYRMCATRR